jgi:hypothetical protein
MTRRIDKSINSAHRGQARRRGVLLLLAAMTAPLAAALAGCVNSTLLDPPPLFAATDASRLSDCGGSKGEGGSGLRLCADANTSTGAPITLSVSLPYGTSGRDTVGVIVTIYDTRVHVVRHLLHGRYTSPSILSEPWDLNDDEGRPVPPGDYRVILHAGPASDERHGDVTIYG